MKRRWFGAAAIVVAACAISVFSARRIEAQYSSPVKVVNTTSAPAIASLMDNPGRIAYLSVFRNDSCSGATGPFVSCDFFFPTVPAGHRLVVQRVSGVFSYAGGSGSLALTVTSNALSGFHDGVFFPTTPPSFAAFGSELTTYYDAGDVPLIQAFANGSTFDGGSQVMTLTGYMLDCTAAPCAAIAH